MYYNDLESYLLYGGQNFYTDGIISAGYCALDSVDGDYTLAEYETGYSSGCYFYEECISSWDVDGSSYGAYETGTDYDITDM